MSPPSLAERLQAIGSVMPAPFVAPKKPARERRPPVPRSRELDRILALPQRDTPSAEVRDLLRGALTREGAELRLWDLQCDALLAALELVDARPSIDGHRPGLYAPIAVGGGKTLIAALLGTVWGAQRPVILTTAALAAQGLKELDRYRRSFYVPERLEVVSYSILSHPDHEGLLSRLEPDALICDEAHALLGKGSARSKRIRRYLSSAPHCRVALLSGSVAKASLMEWAELAGIALGDWSPAPRDRKTRIEWAEALDPEDAQGSILSGRDVGALEVFAV